MTQKVWKHRKFIVTLRLRPRICPWRLRAEILSTYMKNYHKILYNLWPKSILNRIQWRPFFVISEYVCMFPLFCNFQKRKIVQNKGTQNEGPPLNERNNWVKFNVKQCLERSCNSSTKTASSSSSSTWHERINSKIS